MRTRLTCDRRELELLPERITRAMAILTGRTRNPTKRSETARLHSKMVDGVRREGFLHTAASTKTLPVMHIGISRALRTLFVMITEVSKGEDIFVTLQPTRDHIDSRVCHLKFFNSVPCFSSKKNCILFFILFHVTSC